MITVQEDGDGLVSGNSNPKKQSKKAALPQEKGETNRRKRKISQQNAPCDVETASSKKMIDSKIPYPVDNDKELTPEDLLSIAEEYVKADNDVVLQELSIRECDFGRQLSSTASSKTESESSLIALDGPLLKKTVEEKRTEFIMRDLTFSNELGKGSQNDVKEETAPLTKKKCTLRNKFLNYILSRSVLW
ncbi:hypothetical protein CRYUN_Cryun06bG0155600 [Craigia yunnanensis]